MAFTAGQRLTAAALNSALTVFPTLLQTTTVTSPLSSQILTVPAGYQRVKVNWRIRSSVAGAAEQLFLRMNGDTGSHYLWQVDQSNNATVAGSSSGALAAQIQIGTVTGSTATANYFASGEFVVDGIADATNFATAIGIGAAFATTTNSFAGDYSGQWAQSAVVTSLTLFCATGNIAAGSVISIYGLP